MPKDSESLPPTPYASSSKKDLGEWDSPHHQQSSLPRSSTSLTSTRGATPSTRTTSQALTRKDDYKPTYSKYKQEILSVRSPSLSLLLSREADDFQSA